MKSRLIITVAAAVAGAFLMTGCVRMGIEPATGFLFDDTDGTFYVNPKYMEDFHPAALQKYKKAHVSKITIPLPYTFGALSFGWGDISTEELLKDSKFKELVYVDYHRLNVLTVYNNYDLTVYGIPDDKPVDLSK